MANPPKTMIDGRQGWRKQDGKRPRGPFFQHRLDGPALAVPPRNNRRYMWLGWFRDHSMIYGIQQPPNLNEPHLGGTFKGVTDA